MNNGFYNFPSTDKSTGLSIDTGSFAITGSNQFSGSQTITGSLNVTQGITGSLFGTASFATTASYALNALSSSFAQTASVAPNYLPLTGGTIAGSLTINNNLTVLGSASIQYISESVLNIGTNLITVNTINPGARFGGLAVIDSGSSPQVSASFLYDSVQDEFLFVHKGTAAGAITSSIFLLGPETYNDLGNETYLTANRIPKGTGIEHLNDSNISDNGSVVSINSNTQITGSLNVTAGVTGSFSGSGANLNSIPASAITGLNLSQIATGSITASVTPTEFSVISGSTTEFTVTGTGVTIGSISTDIHTVTGSLSVSQGITGSLFGTSSWSNNAITASYVENAQTASYVLQAVSSSFAATASFALNAGGGGTSLGLTQAIVVGLQNIF